MKCVVEVPIIDAHGIPQEPASRFVTDGCQTQPAGRAQNSSAANTMLQTDDSFDRAEHVLAYVCLALAFAQSH